MTDRSGPGKPLESAGALEAAIRPLTEFVRLEAAGGTVLICAAAVGLGCGQLAAGGALCVAPRPPDGDPARGRRPLSKPLLLWINDGLMAVFFFLVGLELKREVLEGHPSSLSSAILPALAAVYVLINRGDPDAMAGWAIPATTDFAFALGVLSLLGERVPPVLKAFLLSVAIFNDIGAITIIAIFNTSELAIPPLLIAGVLLAVLFALNRLGVTRRAAYVLVGVALWAAVLESGVHATLAGGGSGDVRPASHRERSKAWRRLAASRSRACPASLGGLRRAPCLRLRERERVAQRALPL